jgi:hypothetical protein
VKNRTQKIAAILKTAAQVDVTFPRTRLDRSEGSLSSTGILLNRALRAADECEVAELEAAMLKFVLSVASDRVVAAAYAEREEEERILADYHADRQRGAA